MLTALKYWRLRRGLLQVTLSQESGVGRARISELECGHVAGRPDELSRIAAVLGIPIRALGELPEVKDDAKTICPPARGR